MQWLNLVFAKLFSNFLFLPPLKPKWFRYIHLYVSPRGNPTRGFLQSNWIDEIDEIGRLLEKIKPRREFSGRMCILCRRKVRFVDFMRSGCSGWVKLNIMWRRWWSNNVVTVVIWWGCTSETSNTTGNYVKIHIHIWHAVFIGGLEGVHLLCATFNPHWQKHQRILRRVSTRTNTHTNARIHTHTHTNNYSLKYTPSSFSPSWFLLPGSPPLPC